MKINNIAFIFGVILFRYIDISGQEIRGGIELEHEFTDKIETCFQFQLRNSLENNANIVNQTVSQINIEYSPVNNLEISGTYRYTHEIKDENKIPEFNNEDKHRISADISYKTKKLSKDVLINNRFRYQYSIHKDGNEKYYLRNKLKCKYKFTKKVFPYAAIEPFYSINKKTINTFRLYLGSEFNLPRNNINLYIINELSTTNTRYTVYHIIGFSYKL